MATDMSPLTFSLPCMKAMVPSSWPVAIFSKSSFDTTMVQSAGLSSLVTEPPSI